MYKVHCLVMLYRSLTASNVQTACTNFYWKHSSFLVTKSVRGLDFWNTA